MKWAGATAPLGPSTRRGEGEFRAGVAQLQALYGTVIVISKQNVEIVHQPAEAWNPSDVGAILAQFDAECEVVFPP
jgi:hypothetical protein